MRYSGTELPEPWVKRARKKAQRANDDVGFAEGVVEALPSPDAHFDVVLSTLMLHHLPRNARREFAREVRRVLKPGGRVLAVDFGPTPHGQRSFLGHIHRHGHVAPSDIIDVLTDAGLSVGESGTVGVRNLYYALAMTTSLAGAPMAKGKTL